MMKTFLLIIKTLLVGYKYYKLSKQNKDNFGSTT
jgi:hypothetical protein